MLWRRPGSSFSSCFSLLLAAPLALSCVGEIGDTDGIGETEELICGDDIVPGASPIRRLTKFEYDNTIRDLLGDETHPASIFPAEEQPLGFSNHASALNVTPILAEKYMLAAEGVALRATEDVHALTGCQVAADQPGYDACARSYLETFAPKAFRRPVTTEEIEELFAVYDSAWEIYADELVAKRFREGVAMAIESALQTPAFMYRVELGEGLSPVDPKAEIMPLTSWEMASRLSYFIWGTMPDEELLAFAEADELLTKEQVAAQARRMLGNGKAREAVAMFHQQWLDYDRVNNVTKDPALFPEWSPALALLMQEEMRQFVDHVIFDEAGDLKTLLTAPYSYADSNLAIFYGGEASGAAFERIDFPKNEHAGLLSMGALLSYYAHTNQTSPVHRGKLVREAFLCDILDPPPADVQFDLPEPSPDSTARERFSQHSADPACSGCHSLMDPLGFGFENFDALGRYRDKENGQTIDASGSIIDSDIDGSFDGVRELAEKLAASDEVKACYAKMWFRYAYGRGEQEKDACTLNDVEEAFGEADGNVKELLVALTQTDAFLYRFRGPVAEGGD